MIHESNTEINIDTNVSAVQNDYVYIVQVNSYRRKPGIIELKTYPEYFDTYEDAQRFVRSMPLESERDVEISYHIQELSRAIVKPRLVIDTTPMC